MNAQQMHHHSYDPTPDNSFLKTIWLSTLAQTSDSNQCDDKEATYSISRAKGVLFDN
jgi:hypothetical protein